MPQKFRQRGKKKKAGDKQGQQQELQPYEASAAGPSHSRRDRERDQAQDDGDTYTRRPRASIRQQESFGNSNLIPLGGGGGDVGDAEDLSYPQTGEQGEGEGEAPPAHIPVDLGGNLEAEASAHDLDVAPFGFVPAELKAYLKDAYTNLVQLDADSRRSRYEYEGEEEEEDGDGEEGQADLLRQAMLREVSGQELTVATDGECSVAFETIIDGLKGRRVRVLADRASGR